MTVRIKKEILFIQPEYAHYRRQLFKILNERHKIHFVFGRSVSKYPGEIQPEEISYTFLDNKSGLKAIRLLFYLIKHRPDIVISSISHSYRSVISYLYARFCKKHFVLWILEWQKTNYSSNLFNKVGRFTIGYIGTRVIKKCDSLVVGGTAAKQYAVSLGKDDGDIFIAFQCSEDLSQKKYQDVEKIKQKNKNFNFLFMSRIIPYKGLDVLIKAFHELRKERSDVCLSIGGDGWFRKYCHDLAMSLKIPDIKFFGAVHPRDVALLYQKSDVFILPSCNRKNAYEAWGLVINEAMSMGLPVITTTAVGAAYDLIINGYNGFIVKENNVNELYKAMRKIISLDLCTMGQNSRTMFEKKNDYMMMANGFTRAIERELSRIT